MIALRRFRTPPSALSSAAARQVLDEAEEFFARETRSARQRVFDFDQSELLLDRELFETLKKLTSRRCAFCTREKGEGVNLLVHRFRPPQNSVGGDGRISRRHYWWLAFTWENLYLSCEECHLAQGDKFPIEGRRVRSGTRVDLARREKPLLIDPCVDDPERFLLYLDTGEVVARDLRGRATIEVFSLNRFPLVQDRREAVSDVQREIRHIAMLLRNEDYGRFLRGILDLYSVQTQFAALRRQYVNQWVQVRPRMVETALQAASSGSYALGHIVGSLRRVTNRVKREAADDFFGYPEEGVLSRIERPAGTRDAAASPNPPLPARRQALSYLAPARIRRIEIRNFRAIASLDLDFMRGRSDYPWMTLLGENGTGKTSVLYAIALTLAGQRAIEELDLGPRHWLRNGSDEGHIRIYLDGTRKWHEVRFGDSLDGFEWHGAGDGVLVAGYGATRLLAENAPRESRGIKVENLFDPFTQMVTPKAWLPTLSSEEFDAVARALRALLHLTDDEVIQRSSAHGLEIFYDGHHFTLGHLSDGYKAMAVFALDLMQMFLQRWGSIQAAEGVVLVDELGAHLHPRWQMKVTRALRDTFPRVQFVATTHDPLCLRGLQDGEVVVLRRTEEGRIYALHDELPPVEGLAVDQLLTSEHFGLSSSLDPDIEQLFNRYYDLLARRSLSTQREDELAALTNKLAELQQFGSSRRERLALEAVDDLLALERRMGPGKGLSDLNEQAKSVIQSAWQRL